MTVERTRKLLPHQTVATAFIPEEEIPKLELLLFLLFVIFDSTATTIFKRTTASDSESKKTYFAPPKSNEIVLKDAFRGKIRQMGVQEGEVKYRKITV